MNTARAARYVAAALLGIMAAGCNTTTVKTTEHEQVRTEPVPIAENLLLDVGIGIFNPGVGGLGDEDEAVFARIREAEARFMPFKLAETLQNSGNWGAVRVIPDRQSEMDVWVDAEILKSDGATLVLQVSVEDASGRQWYTKRYEESASKYSYADDLATRMEPFQGTYNQIANDMLVFRQRLNAADVAAIRQISELKFAKEFSPEAFSNHLEVDDRGDYHIKRLPAANDPILVQVRQIRERDYVFVDTLQEYYASFVRQMEEPYREWREAYYVESKALKEVQAKSNARLIGGALAVLAGILAQGVDSRTANAAGWVGIGAGATAVMSGLNKREEAKIHIEALEEISASLNSEIEPHTITLEDRTVTLTGTVTEQYHQWRQILKDLYAAETGKAPATN
ncbi:MAG: hypothetical protein HYY48_10570 [Gammaproteobacteria bacterium]|nr:hypothetical protein [Gammaproteobacteria bacterium]